MPLLSRPCLCKWLCLRMCALALYPIYSSASPRRPGRLLCLLRPLTALQPLPIAFLYFVFWLFYFCPIPFLIWYVAYTYRHQHTAIMTTLKIAHTKRLLPYIWVNAKVIVVLVLVSPSPGRRRCCCRCLAGCLHFI